MSLTINFSNKFEFPSLSRSKIHCLECQNQLGKKLERAWKYPRISSQMRKSMIDIPHFNRLELSTTSNQNPSTLTLSINLLFSLPSKHENPPLTLPTSQFSWREKQFNLNLKRIFFTSNPQLIVIFMPGLLSIFNSPFSFCLCTSFSFFRLHSALSFNLKFFATLFL